MGIGRRSFLRTFSAVIATVAAEPLRSFVIADDLYVNRKLGFACRKPPNWDFAFAYELGKLVTGPYVDDKDHAVMAEISKCTGNTSKGLLVLSSEKYSSRDRHIAPVVQICVEHDPDHSEFEVDWNFAEHYAAGFRGTLSGQEQGPIQLLRISNCDAIRFDFNLTTHSAGQSYEWCVDYITIFQRPLAYLVAMMSPAQSRQRFDYDAFVQSIRIA